MCAFHENCDRTLNSHFYTLISQKCRMLLSSTELFFEASSTKSVDPDQFGLGPHCLPPYLNKHFRM